MSEKGKAILAYVFTWIGGLIVLFGMKDNERNTKIHAAQAIVIGIGYMILVVIYNFIPIYIPFFSKILLNHINKFFLQYCQLELQPFLICKIILFFYAHKVLNYSL